MTDGIVTGVKGSGRNGQTITVNGKDVILTTGGFAANTKNASKIQHLLVRN